MVSFDTKTPLAPYLHPPCPSMPSSTVQVSSSMSTYLASLLGIKQNLLMFCTSLRHDFLRKLDNMKQNIGLTVIVVRAVGAVLRGLPAQLGTVAVQLGAVLGGLPAQVVERVTMEANVILN